MNAKEFIKQYGWEKAKEVFNRGSAIRSAYFDTKTHYFFDGTPVRNGIDVNRVEFLRDLKQLVDAWELVSKYGGVLRAKIYLKRTERMGSEINLIIARAIELVESVK